MLSKKAKFPLVRCYICKELRVSEKYRRHLRLHVSAGEIPAGEVEEILFKSKYTRKDSLLRAGISFGLKCTVSIGNSICGVYVKDLRTHLIKSHMLQSDDEIFLTAIENSIRCAKSIEFNDCSSHKHVFDKIDLSTFNMAPISNSNSTSTVESTLPCNSVAPDCSPCESESDLIEKDVLVVDSHSKEEICQLQSKYPFINSEMLVMISAFKKFYSLNGVALKMQLHAK